MVVVVVVDLMVMVVDLMVMMVVEDLANLNNLSWGGGVMVVVVVVRIFIGTIVLRLTPSWRVWGNLNSRPVRAGLE